MDKHYFIQLLDKYLKGQASEEEKCFLISYYDLFESEPYAAGLEEEEKKQIASDIKNQIWQNIAAKENVPAKRISFRNKLPRIAAAAIFIILCTGALLFFNPALRAKPALVNLLNLQKENRLIRLPDGSTVIVNIGAKLTYPASFDNVSQREVYLEGEAFFDISHDPTKPFIVHAGRLETTVLGTAFNIKATPGDENIIVTVSRGKVKISDTNKTLGLLTRGQQIIYDKKRHGAVQNTIPPDVKLDWKKQDVFLDDVTVEDAAKLLEERFDVKILIEEPGIRNSRFTTVFLKTEGLEQVLKSICEFNSAAYQYNQQTATITISRISTPNN